MLRSLNYLLLFFFLKQLNCFVLILLCRKLLRIKLVGATALNGTIFLHRILCTFFCHFCLKKISRICELRNTLNFLNHLDVCIELITWILIKLVHFMHIIFNFNRLNIIELDKYKLTDFFLINCYMFSFLDSSLLPYFSTVIFDPCFG